ncbi:MAG: helix-turn-helix domain-containing protein [Prevotellaceae bacterium]|jgi:transcriptional regulator with XRE-family HTH domain|nr:helix-turn-helix domain-containing protein [Prevotellaceae bacterium]
MEMKDIIDKLMRSKNLNNIEFAKKIGIQRSNVNHFLSGRNNPGLNFFLKTLDAFPDINAEWLLTGKGNMYKTGNKMPNIDHASNTGNADKPGQPQNTLSPTLFTELPDSANNQPEKQPTEKKETIVAEKEKKVEKEVENKSGNISYQAENKPDNPQISETVSSPKMEIPEKRIETVIIFNSDGTCKSYKLLT